MNSIGIVFGLPRGRIAADVDLGRLVRRQARLLGRATSAPRSETELDRTLADANRRLDAVIRRVEAARRRPDIPPELRAEIRAEIERFQRGPQDHRYRWVALADVGQDVREAVGDGVWRACNRLGGFPAASDVTPPLPAPVVRFFRRARDGEVANFTDARLLNGQHFWETNFVDIRIGADRTPAQCRATAVHECWHWGGDDRFRHDEAAAENFRGGLVLAD